MRCVIQRVTRASVTVSGERVSEIQNGFLVLVGAEEGDTEADARYCADKIAGLRVFEDENDKMNLSLKDVAAACCWCRSLRFWRTRATGDGRTSLKPRARSRRSRSVKS